MVSLGLEAIVQLIQQHGVIAVMVAAIVEEIVVPIPSPVVPMAAGFLLVESTELLPALFEILVFVALPASLASVVSSYFVYSIAFYGGKPIIENYGRYLDLSWGELQRFEHHFDSGHEKYYVALFRAIPIVPLSLVSGAAGLFRMDWKQYGLWSFVGMLPRNFVLAYIGWTVKDDFLAMASRIDTLSTLVMVLTTGTVVAFLGYRRFGDAYVHILRGTGK